MIEIGPVECVLASILLIVAWTTGYAMGYLHRIGEE